MRKRVRSLPRRWAALIVAGVMAVGIGAVVTTATAATDPGGWQRFGTYNTCWNTSKGTVRKVLSTSSCRSGETKIRWFGAGSPGAEGEQGPQGGPGADGISGYEVFTSVQDFGPGGIGGAWCGAPETNTEDEGWRVIGGGATFTAEDVNKGVAVVSSWPNLDDPENPGWSVQVNKPTNVNPGEVTLYAVCAKTAAP
jgi:hypothetical protein